MDQKNKEFQTLWAKIIAKAWSDSSFKEKLLQNPQAVLESHGIEIPKGMHVEIVENTNETCYLTLPQKPQGELSEEKLAQVAAGSFSHSLSSNCR